ncbi:Vacuolar protein sorting-associated protein 11 [Microbotryomycetes sp. JL201]|nr:Vacuolar protein sorting-associated protein 11 [Microbotryomycetes sp. JL201]
MVASVAAWAGSSGLANSSATLSEVAGEGHWFDSVLNSKEVNQFVSDIVNGHISRQEFSEFTVTTVNPDETGSVRGFRIRQVEVPGRLARLHVEIIQGEGCVLRTTNVRTIEIDGASAFAGQLAGSFSLRVDGNDVGEFDERSRTIVTLDRSELSPQQWKSDDGTHSIRRYGPLISILKTSLPILIVTGTRTNHLNHLVSAAQRVAHDILAYGSVDSEIMTDADVIADIAMLRGRNVVLLGSSHENALTEAFASDWAVPGDTFPVSSCFPVAGNSRSGLELALRLFPIQTGVTVPEWAVVSDDLTTGGIQAAGFWSEKWTWSDKWRQFKFFSQTAVKDHHDPTADAPESVRQPMLISVIHADDDIVLKADIQGNVQQLSPDYDILRSWQAYAGGRCTHVKTVPGWRGIVITVGDESNSPEPLVKVWAADFKNSATEPRLLRSAKVNPSARPHPVTSIAISPSLSHIVLGLAEGTVVAFKHVAQLIESSLVTMQQANDTGSTNVPVLGLGKLRTLHESKEPVTGLGVVGDRLEGGKRSSATLFIVTTSRVLSYSLSTSSSKTPIATLDNVGANVECAAAIRLADGDKMVVARDEAIYVYSIDGREGCYAYEGSKSSLRVLSSDLATNPPKSNRTIYLAMVTPPQTASRASQSATIRDFARSQGRAASDVAKLTIFDPVNKFVAFSSTFEEGIKDLWEAWGAVWVLTDAGQLYRLAEQPLQSSLSELFSRNLYTLAVSLAQSRDMFPSEIAEIQRRYGDFLYGKGDFEGAIGCYIKTVGTVQPSYVIRKFLHAQRLSHLTSYLQELHSHGLANSDHTTLLLNCYTKLADDKALSDFLHTSAACSDGKAMNAPVSDTPVTEEPPFDLETAIRVCRQAGYFDHAVWLAERYKEHSEYLRIQVEDRHDYQQALAYLRRLEPRFAQESLVRYGRFLLDAEPDKTTELLISLCCGKGGIQRDDRRNGMTEREDVPKTNGVGVTTGTFSYLAYGTAAEPGATTLAPEQGSLLTRPQRETPEQTRVDGADLPAPRLFFALFADHPRQFIQYLETVAETRYGRTIDTMPDGGDTQRPLPSVRSASKLQDDVHEDAQDEIDLWNTLLELWISESMVEDDPSVGRVVPRQERLALQSKALRMLQTGERIPYDETQALLVCTTLDFEEGFILLYEQLGMYEDIVRYWIKVSRSEKASALASGKVLQALRRYGPAGPGLYRTVLKFLTSDNDILSRHHDDVVDILATVEETKVLAPISVIQILSATNAATVGLVRDYLQRHLASEKQQVEADQGLIKSYRTETMTKRKEIKELSDRQTPRVLQVTRCSACGGQLELPAVHFMCRHSYHQRCLGDSTASHETQCPTCARSHGVVQELRRAHEQSASDHDMFLQDVREGEDGFKAVADAFGRGALSFAASRSS